jgi:hypothetical protein
MKDEQREQPPPALVDSMLVTRKNSPKSVFFATKKKEEIDKIHGNNGAISPPRVPPRLLTSDLCFQPREVAGSEGDEEGLRECE